MSGHIEWSVGEAAAGSPRNWMKPGQVWAGRMKWMGGCKSMGWAGQPIDVGGQASPRAHARGLRRHNRRLCLSHAHVGGRPVDGQHSGQVEARCRPSRTTPMSLIGVSSCSFNWKNNTYSAFIVLERSIHEYLASDKMSWHVRFGKRPLTAVFRILQFNLMWKKQLDGLMLELMLQSSHWNGMVYLG